MPQWVAPLLFAVKASGPEFKSPARHSRNTPPPRTLYIAQWVNTLAEQA